MRGGKEESSSFWSLWMLKSSVKVLILFFSWFCQLFFSFAGWSSASAQLCLLLFNVIGYQIPTPFCVLFLYFSFTVTVCFCMSHISCAQHHLHICSLFLTEACTWTSIIIIIALVIMNELLHLFVTPFYMWIAIQAAFEHHFCVCFIPPNGKWVCTEFSKELPVFLLLMV